MKKCTVFPTFRPFVVGAKLRKVLPLLAFLLASCELPTDTESDQSADLESASSIVGVWMLVEREIQGGSDPRIESGSQIQPSILIYTEQYFSWNFVLGTKPRELVDDSPSDEAIGAAARLYNSAAGIYELDGSTLRYHRVVSIRPARMLPENQPFERQLVAITSNTLETSTSATSTGVTTTLRYTRVE